MTAAFLVAKVYRQPRFGADAYLGLLPLWTALSAGQQLNDADLGSVTVRLDNPRLADYPDLLDYGNVIKVSVGHDTPPVAAFRIEKKQATLISDGGEQAPAVTVSGAGIAQEAREWQVYAEAGYDPRMLAQRTFSWASLLTGRWYDPAQWHKAVSTGPYGKTYPWRGNPTGFPASSAQWIWDRANGGLGVPAGDVYFRASFELATASVVTVWASIDNFGEVYVDGQQVCTMARDSGWAWNQISTGSITLPAGTHLIAVHATNAQLSATGIAGAAGLLLACGIPNSSGGLGTLLRVSDESWVCLPYPTAYPGWSIGDVWRQLMAEAALRGCSAAEIPLGFTADADSAGRPWGEPLDWPLNTGDYYRDFLDTTAAEADWAFDPDSYRLDLWQNRGTDRTVNQPGRPAVRLRPLRDVTQASSEITFEPVNTLLIQTSAGYREIADAGTSRARFGRREGYLTVTDQHPTLAGRVAAQAFTAKALPAAAPTIGIDPQKGAVPWTDFDVGDLVLAPPDEGGLTSPPVPRRVVSLSVAADQATGRPKYEAELGSIGKDRADRMARWLASIGHGTLGGVVAAAGHRATGAAIARVQNPYPTGAGPLGVRTTAGWRSDPLPAGATVQDTVVLSTAYTLYRLAVSAPARLRIYASADQQAADVNRPAATPPAGDHGVLLDVSLTGTALSRTLTPALTAASLDEPASVNIPITVTNLTGGQATLAASFDYMATG